MTAAEQDSITGLEPIVPTFTDNTTDGSRSELDEAPALHDRPADIGASAGTCEEAEVADEVGLAGTPEGRRAARFSSKRIIGYGILPALALILAFGGAYLKWQAGSAALARTAAVQSTQAATESTITMLSYRPDTVDKELPAAANRLTGKFRDEYSQLINQVVVPGAKQKRISAVASVPGAASVSATENHAVVLVFVNQTITIGDDAPTDTASTVTVTLDKVHGRWLISRFEPV